jgi:DNA polymerase-1
LRALGFVTILQVHDELVMEGLENNAEAARMRLKYLMETCYPLRLGLQVSAKTARNWAEGK